MLTGFEGRNPPARNDFDISKPSKRGMYSIILRDCAANLDWIPRLLLIQADRLAECLIDSLKQSLSLEHIGSIKDECGKSFAEIYCSFSLRFIIFCDLQKIDSSNYSKFAKCIFSYQCELCVLLDRYSIFDAKLHGLNAHSKLHYVVTHGVPFLEGVDALMLFEPGNLIRGFAASILCFAVPRKIPLAAFFAMSGGSYCVTGAKCFESIIPILEIYLNVRDISYPDKADYKCLLSADQYINDTVNLYS